MEPSVPVGAAPSWTRGARVDASHMVSAVLSLKHQPENLVELEEKFWAVSDPQHADYGKHLSNDEVARLLAPPEDSLRTVLDWLAFNRVEMVDAGRNQDLIKVELPAVEAEKLFATQFHVFQHAASGRRIIRAVQPYSLPAEVAEAVVLVEGILRFPAVTTPITVPMPASNRTDAWPAGCGGKCPAGWVTPDILSQRYAFPKPSAAAAAAAQGSMAVAEFQGQRYTNNVLTSFGKACAVPAGVDKSVGKGSTLLCELPVCTESLLDIEYIKGVAGDVPLTDIYSDTYSLLDWAKSVLDMSSAPLVHSVSYGNDEIQQTSVDYMDQCNVQFKALGAKGISVLFASGDQGVYGRTGPKVFGKDGGVFNPDFPAGSPYITAVGGTNFASPTTVGPEAAWSAGGGGFSNTFAIPSYQAAAVKGYKAKASLPPAELWNNTGRGYPDVAALGGQAAPYCIKDGLTWSGVAGTSAASPVVAGVFALLNELRLAAGKPALGFLNPFIYQNPGGFFDVTQGENKASGKYGFKATAGWDPATGMGTPNYAALKKLV